VLFFAGASEAAGVRSAKFDGSVRTVGDLVEQLFATYGAHFQAVASTCAIWVNGLPVQPGTMVHEGDEVAVLPPVSGGCAAASPGPKPGV
jgi:sulfur-carrier protein